jgi:amino acid adenylation domain-containing protein
MPVTAGPEWLLEMDSQLDSDTGTSTGTRKAGAASGRIRRRVVDEWNRTQVDFPRNETIVSLFEEQAARSPCAVALVSGARELSYRELDALANRLARRLSRLGVGSETLVGLSFERSIEAIVAALGVLKAGGVYTPLDPAYPKKRLEFMLEDTGIRVLVTESELANRFPLDGIEVLCLDDDADCEGISDEPLSASIRPSDLAYVMYTSGSTGRPKGTQVEHRNVVRLVRGASYTEFGPGQRVLALAPLSFDASTFELWGPLLNGGRCIVYPDRVPDAQRVVELIAAHGVTDLFLTTALFNAFVDSSLEGLKPLRVLMTGGETHSLQHFRRALSALGDTRIVHVYGPTETTTFATSYEVPSTAANSSQAIPIGRPIANTTTYVLDETGEPVAPGITGELFIGGDGVARGYLNRPELTAERFVPDRFGSDPEGRLYRTGDMVRWREDGVIEFVGREDHQVKVHGFRIELGEIETALRDDPSVGAAIVVLREDEPGDKRVVAYVVPAADAGIDSHDLRIRLSEALPDYMIPGAFVVLESFPLTPNGKIDRNVLPQPAVGAERVKGEGSKDASAFVEPQTATEIAVAAIFTELLGIGDIGSTDDFFELGGHSIKAIQLAGRIRDRFGVPLTVDRLFDLSTPRDMSGAIDRALAGDSSGPPTIRPRPRSAHAPTSYAQRRIWFIQNLDPENLAYNYQGALRFTGDLNIDALSRALTEIVSRHEIYRSTFPEVDGEPVQMVEEPWQVKLELLDLGGRPEEERFAEAQKIIHLRGRERYDMTRLPLVKWFLIRLSATDHLLAHLEHHIVHDGWSLNVLLTELVAFYRAYSSQVPHALASLELQFADYATWERHWLDGGALREGLDYWRAQLGDCPELLELPTDRPRTARQTFDGGIVQRRLPGATARRIRELSRAGDATLFMTMQCVFAILLSRFSRQTDICIGAGIANRHWQTEGLIGMFINNVVLRHDLSGDPSFATLQRRARKIVRDAQRYQYVPFEKVVQEINAVRSQGHNPLYQVMFSFHDAPLPKLDLPGLEISHQELVHNGTAKFDLNVISIPRREQRTGSLQEAGDEIDMFWEFNSNLFDRESVERMADGFERLLVGISDPDSPISELSLLSDVETSKIVQEWNATVSEYPRQSTIVEIFEAQVARSPDAVALIAGDEAVSYRELNARANRLAHRLRSSGVGREAAVGLCMERSIELVVGILGILKAGGAYVPLDPEYPKPRLAFMLEDVAAHVLLTMEALLDRLPDTTAEVVCLDRERDEIQGRPADGLSVGIGPQSLAYVIYTSGSTGEPKGVCIEHRSVLRLVKGADYTRLTPETRILMLAPVFFDASTFELWGALLNGGVCVLYPERVPNVDLLGEMIARHGITDIFLTTALFNSLVDSRPEVLKPLECLLTGGEAHSLPHFRRALGVLNGGTKLVHVYGPTETTTFATAYALPKALSDDVQSVPIGRPIANTTAYVLDAHQRPVPVGVPGELYIGGDGVARGYLNRPVVTGERFLPDPFTADPGERMYRTGDIVRWRADGTIDFMGRDDHQVKIRGFRIELGEIQAALLDDPKIADAIVSVREDAPDGKRIVAHVVTQATADGVPAATPAALRAGLRERLPNYMVPSAVVILDAFPLTPNGKVNRAALPAPDFVLVREYVAPRTPVEESVAGIFSDVLGVDRVGINDNFFELGGHSLMAMQVVSRLRQVLAFALPLAEFFDLPTVADLSDRIGDLSAVNTAAEDRERFEL